MDYLSLCLVCKDENDYLSEWLDYHILMGVDRFYIYDNESRVSLRETLKGYIERGWVVVVDIPGQAMQLYAYDHCLQTFGAQTFWLGFIDTDEFLVPKAARDLKELLREYEQYAGLAVSSLFFGSSGHVTRPVEGQIGAYTLHIQATIKEFELVKSIVQPRLVLMPNSPHDFVYKEGVWCVNEGFLRVDFQRFPSHTEKIQLNHYYCRSENEIDEKLRRGNSQTVTWLRERFDTINLASIYEDTSILQKLESQFKIADVDFSNLTAMPLIEKMAALARARSRLPLELVPPTLAHKFRPELVRWLDIKVRWKQANESGDIKQALQLELDMLRLYPHHLHLYVVAAINYLKFDEPSTAWKALITAWQFSPNNNYNVLGGMALYFLYIENFNMAEKVCRLLLEIAPHDMLVMGLLTQSLIGQNNYEEALRVGIPVMEMVGTINWELSEGMGLNLVRKLAGYLQEKKDYIGAISMWEVGVKCQPDDVNTLLGLTQALLQNGDMPEARKRLAQAQILAPHNESVLAILSKINAPLHGQVGIDTATLPIKKSQKRKHR